VVKAIIEKQPPKPVERMQAAKTQPVYPAEKAPSKLEKKNIEPIAPATMVERTRPNPTNVQLRQTALITFESTSPASVHVASKQVRKQSKEIRPMTQEPIEVSGAPIAMQIATHAKGAEVSPNVQPMMPQKTVTKLSQGRTRFAKSHVFTTSAKLDIQPKLPTTVSTIEPNQVPIYRSSRFARKIDFPDAKSSNPLPLTNELNLASLHPATTVAHQGTSLKPMYQASLRPQHDGDIPLSEGDALDLGEIRRGFSDRIWGKIANEKYYPRAARKRGYEGAPVVEFTIGENGKLLNLSLAKPSSYKTLDEAALKAVKNAGPYPDIPGPLNLKSINFKLPITFILEEP
jgi:TonB family protein